MIHSCFGLRSERMELSATGALEKEDNADHADGNSQNQDENQAQEDSPFIEIDVTPAIVRRSWRRVCNSVKFVNILQDSNYYKFLEHIQLNERHHLRKTLYRHPEYLERITKDKTAIQIALSDKWVETKTIKLLLEKNADIYYKNEEGWEALHFASLGNNWKLRTILNHIKETKPSAVNAQTNKGENSLLLLLKTKFASSLNNHYKKNKLLDTCSILLDYGADVNCLDKEEEEGITPLLFAAKKGDKDLLNLFIKHKSVIPDLDSHKSEGKTAREWILEKNLFEPTELPSKIPELMFKYLENKGKVFWVLKNFKLEYVNVKNENGETLLEKCNEKNLIPAARILLDNKVDLTDKKLVIEISSKCGYYNILEDYELLFEMNDLDTIVNLSEIVFKSLEEEETETVNYRKCLDFLIKRYHELHSIIPDFSVNGMYLYVLNMGIFDEDDKFMIEQFETEEGLKRFLDGLMSEEGRTVTYKYKSLMPLNNESAIFSYLSKNDNFQQLLLHPVFKVFLFSEVESKHKMRYTGINAYFLIFIILQYFLAKSFHISVLITALLSQLLKYLFCHIFYIKSIFVMLVLHLILFIIFYGLLAFLATYLEVIKFKFFPLIAMTLYLFSFFFIHINKTSLYHRLLIKTFIIRFIRILADVQVLIFCFSITFFYMFGNEYITYGNFKTTCRNNFCEKNTYEEFYPNCLQTFNNSVNTSEACQNISMNISTIVSSFSDPCLNNLYKVSSKPFCQKLFNEVEQNGYPHEKQCLHIPFFVHHFDFDDQFCKTDIQLKITNFTNTCENLALKSIPDYCKSITPSFLLDFNEMCTSLFCNQTESFTSPFKSLFRTIIMATGEFDASSIDFTKNTFGRYIFLLFILCIHIVLLNVVIALAITDTLKIKIKSEKLWHSEMAFKVNFYLTEYPTRIVFDKKSLKIKKKRTGIYRFLPFLRFGTHLPEDMYDEIVESLRNTAHEKEQTSKNKANDNEKLLLELTKKIDEYNESLLAIKNAILK